MCEEDVVTALKLAFENRFMPGELIREPIAGNEIPAGHPGYGKGAPIENNESDFIHRFIQGRSWREIDATLLEYTILYLKDEAVAYYLPSMLIHNIKHNHELETVDFFLTEYRYAKNVRARDDVYGLLSPLERLGVQKYMEYAPRRYSESDISFWGRAS